MRLRAVRIIDFNEMEKEENKMSKQNPSVCENDF